MISPIGLAERGLLPDALIRMGIHRLNRRRLESLVRGGDAEAQKADFEEMLRAMGTGPIAVETRAAARPTARR